MSISYDPKIDERLAAAVNDTSAWQVYADWLIEHGEPWGEVIAAANAGKNVLDRYTEVRDLAGGIDGLELAWERGAISSLTLTPEEEPEDDVPKMHEVLERLLTHPAGRLVRKLTLGLPPQPAGDIEWNFDAVLETFGKIGPLPLLDTIDMTPSAEHMDQDSWRRLGDFEPVWKAAPRLRELRAKGSAGSDSDGPQLRFGKIVAPHLERIVIESSGLAADAPLDLGRATLPALKDLELWVGQEDYGCSSTLESFAGILSGTGLPKLERLAIKNSEWEVELIDAIASSAILPRLKVVDLSMGILCADATQALIGRASKFKHLERLVLDDNFLLEEHQAALKAALPNVELGQQRELEGDIGDPYSRYVSAGE